MTSTLLSPSSTPAGRSYRDAVRHGKILPNRHEFHEIGPGPLGVVLKFLGHGSKESYLSNRDVRSFLSLSKNMHAMRNLLFTTQDKEISYLFTLMRPHAQAIKQVDLDTLKRLLPKVKRLELKALNQSDDSLVASFQHLQITSFSPLPYIRAYASKEDLVELHLTGFRLDFNDLSAFLNLFQAIHTLDLSDTPNLSNGPLTEICKRSLSSLALRNCPLLTNKSLKIISQIPTLTALDVSNSENISNMGISHLKDAHRLQSLALSGLSKISNKALNELSTLVELSTLNLANCSGISDPATQTLYEISTLTSLDISGTSIGNDGIETIQHFMNLTSLAIRGLSVTNLSLLDLSRSQTIQKLDISGCERLSTGCRVNLASFHSLTHLTMRNCPNIAPWVAKALKRNKPHMEIIS